MYTKILSLFVWLYRNKRNEILYVLKNKTYDGKVTISWILEAISLYKKSGLTSTHESEELEEVFRAWDINTPKANSSKKLVMYDQSSWSCVIYTICRSFTYNTGIDLTKDEIESVKIHAKDRGYWKDKEWMTFKDGCQALREWLRENKNIEMTYIRTLIWSDEYNSYINNLWYMGMIWWAMTDKFISDFKVDGIINAIYSWLEKKKYYHAWSHYDEKKNEVDNYPSKFGSNNQRYNGNIWEFISKWYYFWYIYIPLADVEVIKPVWEYRNLAWKSVIENPDRLIEVIRTWSPDEAVASIEIIVNRKIK